MIILRQISIQTIYNIPSDNIHLFISLSNISTLIKIQIKKCSQEGGGGIFPFPLFVSNSEQIRPSDWPRKFKLKN